MFFSEHSYFCVQNQGKFECETKIDGKYDECILGENFRKVEVKTSFQLNLRIKSNNRGEPFSSSLSFRYPIKTKPGNYSLSMYTLINCGSIDCDEAEDTISVKVKDGDNGEFVEIYHTTGRSIDNKWINSFLYFTVRTNKLSVKLFYLKIYYIY